jgi:hypothetical protein
MQKLACVNIERTSVEILEHRRPFFDFMMNLFEVVVVYVIYVDPTWFLVVANNYCG